MPSSDLEDFADHLLIEGRVYDEDDKYYMRQRVGAAKISVESDLVLVTNRTTNLESRVSVAESDISGLEVGETYRVPTLVELPSTINSSGITIYGSVYADTTLANNGTYWKAPGSSTWAKVSNDQSGRISNLENLTASFKIITNLYVEGVLYPLAVVDGLGTFAAGVSEKGKFRFISGTGALDEVAALALRASNLETLTASFKIVTNLYVEGILYPFAIVDGNGIFAAGVSEKGAFRWITGSGGMTQLDIGDASFKPVTNRPGWIISIEDARGFLGFGIKTDGTIIAPLLVMPPLSTGSVGTNAISASAVVPEKLTQSLRLGTSNDMIPSLPDGVRRQLSLTGFRTAQDWRTLPARLTPIVWGVNSTGASLDFRKTCGLSARGQQYIGTWSPGAVPSANLRGTLTDSTSWPPSGTFVSGDYYRYTAIITRVIGLNTLNLADLMVYNGSAWIYQACPGSGTATRYELEWYRVSASGTFEGIVLVSGDAIVYAGYESGVSYSRWFRGAPEQGEFFRRGQFNPSGGLPSSPVDGEMWEASASASAGGFTLAPGDTLFRDAGVWGIAPATPVITVPNGAMINLPCIMSACEWEGRRTSLSPVPLGVTLKTRGKRIPWRGTGGITLASDSTGINTGAQLPALVSPRAVTARTMGGAKSRDILGVIEYYILSGISIPGDVFFLLHGENNNSDLAQQLECDDRMMSLIGSYDLRGYVISMLGVRDQQWNSGLNRFVCDNFEQQVIQGSSNAYSRSRYARASNWPGQFVDFRDVLCASAGSLLDPQYPGMTERQVADTYYIPPFSYFFDYATVMGAGFNPSSLVYKGLWSTAGLPTGGSANDYWLRNGGGIHGNLLINKAGTWIEPGASGNEPQNGFDRKHPWPWGCMPLSQYLVNLINSKNQ